LHLHSFPTRRSSDLSKLTCPSKRGRKPNNFILVRSNVMMLLLILVLRSTFLRLGLFTLSLLVALLTALKSFKPFTFSSCNDSTRSEEHTSELQSQSN